MSNCNHTYLDTLGKLDYTIESNERSSVFLIDSIDRYVKQNVSPYVILALERARAFHADAVYFRYFEDDRPPIPQIYIYDAISNPRSKEAISLLHRDIWSSSEIPLYFIIGTSSICIYDSRKAVKFDIKNSQLNVEPLSEFDFRDIQQFNKAIQEYNARLFDNGSFWNSPVALSNFSYNMTVYNKLISTLRYVRESFRKEGVLPATLSDRLLIISILIKYLEENGGDGDLAKSFFNNAVGNNTLIEIIRHRKLVDLLDCLAEHFNGGIFSFTNDDKELLRSADLEFLASFLEGKLVGNQRVIWEEYSFKHIPVELISNFYEEFLPKEKDAKTGKERKADPGAVYTPGFLVNLLVDECLPLDFGNLCENVKLIDASCGSGIFLVAAFKRLVQRWRIAHRKDGVLAEPTPDVLKDILRRNIFGVDIDANAAELTIFSLNLSLCSMLRPKQIWTELSFDNLRDTGNIASEDFFNYIINDHHKDFDLVIGNPPFKSVNRNAFNKIDNLLKSRGMGFSCKIPDNQMSMMFLDRALSLLRRDGQLCLIMPSGPLLYNRTLEFRKNLFCNYNVSQIIDFTFLSSSLFKDVKVGTAAIFVEKSKPEQESVLHIVARRTKANKEKILFEFDHYDFFNVPRQIACENAFVWKCNLLGGTRIFNLVNKFSDSSNTLISYLQNQKENSGWDYGQGYIVAGGGKTADYITGKDSVIDKYFTERGIGATQIEMSKSFKDVSRKNIFEPPHLLLKKSIGKNGYIPIVLNEDYLTFKNEIIGIHCPKADIEALKRLETIIRDNNELYRLLIMARSSRAGVSRSRHTNLAEDMYTLPISGMENLTYADKVLIHEINEYVIPSFENGENAKVCESASYDMLQSYAEMYCLGLNEIYGRDESQYRLERIINGLDYYACEIIYTKESRDAYIIESDENDESLSSLLEYWGGANCLIRRVIRLYGENRIIIVKPKEARYWLKMVALRDLDDTFNDILSK